MKRIGFIGLGAMGRGACDNLVKKSGLPVFVYDTNIENMNYFLDRAMLCQSIEEVRDNSDIVFLSLPNSDVVESVSEVFLKGDPKDKVIIDMSTSFPASTKKLYKNFKELGGVFIDAPMMGGPNDTAEGTAPCMISGDEEEVNKIKDLISYFASPIDYMGEAGTAHTVKIAMNFTGLGYATLIAQMFPLMEKMGVDTKNLFKVMNEGPFGNWMFDFYGQKTVDKNYRMDFALDLGLKDMTYMKKMYDQYNVPAFMLDGMLDLLRTSLKEGKGSKDYSQCAATMYEYLGLDPNKIKD